MASGNLKAAENSKVLARQAKLRTQTIVTLNEIFKDMQSGLLETVGIDSNLILNERCSVRLILPDGTDTQTVAHAIDLENVEAWCDDEGMVNIAINPWFSTKDVDQSVLCAIKVIHVLLGIHASDTKSPKSLTQKLLSSVAEVMQIQQRNDKKN